MALASGRRRSRGSGDLALLRHRLDALGPDLGHGRVDVVDPDGEVLPDALAKALAEAPELIISDINLQGHSGLEMCEEIKSNAELRDLPVMFLSGAQIPDIIRRSHAAGGTYYLRKPFDPEVLVELVHKALYMPHLVAARQ